MKHLLVLALILGSANAAFSASLSVLPPGGTFGIGSTVTLDVVADAPDLFIYQFDVQYPTFSRSRISRRKGSSPRRRLPPPTRA